MPHPLPPRPQVSHPHGTSDAQHRLVNPYAPHINYNILDLSSLPSTSLKPPPGVNGAGTSGTLSCHQSGCLFKTDSKGVLSQHLMDRHLVYPKGWKHAKRKHASDEEHEELIDEEHVARIKGCTTVPGTTLVLDTPEAIESWKAERKRRWPSSQRVQDKVLARQEALARGELVPPLKPKRQRKLNGSGERPSHGSRGRGIGPVSARGSHRGRGRGARARAGQSFSPHSNQVPFSTPKTSTIPTKRSLAIQSLVGDDATRGINTSSDDSDAESGSDSTESSNSDMDPLRDAVSSKQPTQNAKASSLGSEDGADNDELSDKDNEISTSILNSPTIRTFPSPTKRLRPPPGPRTTNPQNNRLQNRPSLLRNLLLPDIHATVSHFSQAIRFIVSNDFLDNVELKPGDGEKQMVVLSNTENSLDGDNGEGGNLMMDIDVNRS